MNKQRINNVVNVAEVTETMVDNFPGWKSYRKAITPGMSPKEGRLGAQLLRVPSGQTACPFHTHQIEDEIFYILSGRGVLRYGENLEDIGAGDCISCPASTGIAHQIANPFVEDLVYLAMGLNDRREVCTYPDHGTLAVRGLALSGRLEPVDFTAADVSPPKIFSLLAARKS